jgi:hypothetical protein
VWRWIELRSAGFPVDLVLQLAAPQTARAADELLAQRMELDRVRARIANAIAGLPPSKDTRRAAQLLERGRELDRSNPALASLGGQLDELASVEARVRALEATLAEVYEHEDREIGGVLCELAGEPRLREALLWQNRHALHTGVDWLRDHGSGPANRRRRQNQQLLASYLQRYCTKNDTIGFFGPFGFGEIADVAPLVVEPGDRLLSRRRVYFEHWAIDVLARSFAADPELRGKLRPRRMPTVRVEGTTVHYGLTRSVELPRPVAELLAQLDATRTAEQLARDLATPEDDVFEMLEALADKNLCTWTLEVPTAVEPPGRLEHELRRLLDEAGPSGRPGVAALDELEARRDEVLEAAGDVPRLDAALGKLEECFERIASTAATRRSGETYAGRTIVYEECLRDVRLGVGPELLAKLDDTLQILLVAGRWYTHDVATRYLAMFERTFDELSPGGAPVDYLGFWQAIKLHFPMYPAPAPLVTEATAELQRRWAGLLELPEDSRRVTFQPADLVERVERGFAAPGPGWPDARYHAPDIMIAAPSAEAVCRGERLLVLGEFHPSVNTIQLVAQREHADPHALIRAREVDIPETVPTMVIGKQQTTRGDHVWLSRHNIDIELADTRSWRDRDQVIAIADLEVARANGGLVVRDRAGRHVFDIIVFHGNYLTAVIAPEFNLFTPLAHRPRITIGSVVVAREQWRHDARELTFATLPRGAAQFAAVRAWTQESAMPRHVFVRIPEETKPIYVDFESPIYVEMFAKLVRKASIVIVTEMLPGHGDAWLPDAAGQRYTCELRLIAVDPLPWRPR